MKRNENNPVENKETAASDVETRDNDFQTEADASDVMPIGSLDQEIEDGDFRAADASDSSDVDHSSLDEEVSMDDDLSDDISDDGEDESDDEDDNEQSDDDLSDDDLDDEDLDDEDSLSDDGIDYVGQDSGDGEELDEDEDEAFEEDDEEPSLPTADEVMEENSTFTLRPINRLLVSFNASSSPFSDDKDLLEKLRSVVVAPDEDPINLFNPLRSAPKKGKHVDAVGFLYEALEYAVPALSSADNNTVMVFGNISASEALDRLSESITSRIMDPVFEMPDIVITSDQPSDEESEEDEDANAAVFTVFDFVNVGNWSSTVVEDGETVVFNTIHLNINAPVLQGARDPYAVVRGFRRILRKLTADHSDLDVQMAVTLPAHHLSDAATRSLVSSLGDDDFAIVSRDSLYDSLLEGDNLGILPDGTTYDQFSSALFPCGGDLMLLTDIKNDEEDK